MSHGRESSDRGRPPAAPADATALRPVERRRRRRELWTAVAVSTVLAGLVPLALAGRLGSEGRLFLLLNSVTVILILVLGWLVTRNFWKLVLERRRGKLGARLSLKFVSAYVLVAFLTTTGVVLVSSLFITRTIDKWFDVRVDSALEKSAQIAERTYESAARQALEIGQRIGAALAAEGLLAEGRGEALERRIRAWQRDHGLGVVAVFGADGQELLTAVNPDVADGRFAREDARLVQQALAGEAGWEMLEGGGGDTVRAVVPVPHPGRSAAGAVSVNVYVPYALARDVATIRQVLADYRTLVPTAGHIRVSYLLELVLAAVMILMLAFWLSLRLAKGVTRPIRALAEGTLEVARGNLDVRVESQTDDELGVLVESFNRMTRDLREARVRLEESHAELERRRRSQEVVLRTIAAGVVSVDAESRILTMNPSAQRHLGVAAGSGVIGAKLSEVARRPELLEVIEDLARGLRPGVRESRRRQAQVTLDHEVAILLVTAMLLHDETGATLGWVVVLDDATQLVKVQRMAAWREVARRIAHEIKNPLTPIQLSTERIRRRFRARLSAEPEELRVFDECVGAITTQVEGLKLLVDEFSSFARLPTAHPKADDLNRIIRDAVASYAGTEDVVFDADLDPALPTVEVDREQMRRVLTNLIDNAIAAVRRERAGPGPGRVGLRSRYDAALQSVRMEVCDDGAGVPAEDRRRIFEPYFSTKQEGTGLGLAIVSRIVADHRGYVRVQENQPTGARFVVDLPVRGM